MKELRLICVILSLLLATTTPLTAQEKQNKKEDSVVRLIARSEPMHLRSRQNLIKILRDHPRFWVELQAVAKRLKTQPAWLLNVMASESLLNPAAHNSLPGQTASGLLQFIESTARSMGTTAEAVRRMNPIEQLRMVERYLAPYRGRLNNLADLYMAVFRGFIVDGGDTSIVAPLDSSNKEQRIYSLNKWLDLNDDNKITKGELALVALAVGRFSPYSLAAKRLDRNLKTMASETSAVTSPKPAPHQTHSIFIR